MPIPPEILAMYPSRAPLPERPWWRPSEYGARPDGWFPLIRSDGMLAVSMADVLRIDAEAPLPHPGFRVLQAWVWSDCGIVEAATVVHRDSGGVMAMLQAWGATFTISAGAGVFLPDASMPIGRRAVPAWLLADPCCPWLAPWGPA